MSSFDDIEVNPRVELERTLLDEGFARLRATVEALPPQLDSAFATLERDWQGKLGEGGAAALFLGPTGTPAIPLLAWAAESLFEQPASEPMQRAAEATLLWYFALRLQDDLVDEGAPAAGSFLQQALEALAVRRLAEVAGDEAALLGLWSSLVTDFAAAALDDVARRTDPRELWGEEALALQGRKFLPMAAAPAALLIRAGRPELIGPLRQAVEALGLALQLGNDLLSATREVLSQERTPYLAALGVVPGLHGPGDLEPALRRALRRGDHQRFMARTEEAIEAAIARFDGLLASPRMLAHLDARLEALRARVGELELRALAGARPLLADLELTRRCDLLCPSCYVRAQEPALSLAGAAELPTALALEVLEELAGYLTTLHLTGGEPFVHPGVWEVLERAKELGLDVVLANTNGVRLARGGLERLASLGLSVKLLVSVDGPPGTHDRVRGQGTLAAALDVLRRAPALGVEAQPATILTAQLLSYGLDRWVAWLEEQIGEPRPLALWPLSLRPGEPPPAGGVGEPLDAASTLEAARQVAALVERGAEVTVADGPWLNPLLSSLGVPPEKLQPCDAARGRLCVQADGVVSPCHPFRLRLLALEPGRVGGFVARAFATEEARRLAAHDVEGCRGCAEADLCGTCQGLVAARGLPLFSNDWTCRALGTAPDASEAEPRGTPWWRAETGEKNDRS